MLRTVITSFVIYCLTLVVSWSGIAQTLLDKRLYAYDTIVGVPLNTLKTLNLDSLWEIHNSDSLDNSRKFGAIVPVDFNLNNSGTWYNLNDTVRVWRLLIVSPNAVMISLSFENYHLPPKAKLLLYNSDRSMLGGPYTEKNNQLSGRFSTSLIVGDSLFLEYYEPFAYLNQGVLDMSKVIHAYTDPFKEGGAAAAVLRVQFLQEGRSVASCLDDLQRRRNRAG